MQTNHRRSARQHIQYPAQIILQPTERLGCNLRDVSAAGARILVQDAKPLPGDFMLLLSNHGGWRNCHVVWRTDRELGVEFRPLSDAHRHMIARVPAHPGEEDAAAAG